MAALYDIIITKIPSDEARKLLARQLARNPSVSMTEAMGILERLPAIFMREVADHDVPEMQSRLRSMRVESKALLRRRDPLTEPVSRSAAVHVGEVAHASAGGDPAPRSSVPNRIAPPAPRVVFDSIAPPTSPTKSKLLGGLITVLILLAAIVGTIFVLQHPEVLNPPSLTNGSVPVSSLDAQGRSKEESVDKEDVRSGDPEIPPAESAPADSGENERRGSSVTAEDQRLSDSYLDSAMHAKGSFARQYYHLAISLNPDNVKAWNGLIAVCRAENDPVAADSVSAEMNGRFGHAFDYISDIVHPFGDLVNYSTDTAGVCRIEYRSRGRGRENLENETYELVKALAARRDCSEISLYASTGKGVGMLVRIKTVLIPPIAREFSRVAMITYLE